MRRKISDEERIIYDWNTLGADITPLRRNVEFNDETLRDGLQSPSVVDPSIEDKKHILHLMDALGIHSADIGMPCAGPRTKEAVSELAKEIRDARLRLKPNCAARTVIGDIVPIVEISQSVGIPIEACTFLGSSPIRQYVEGWSVDDLKKLTEKAVGYAVKEGLPVMFVTEDTTRAKPKDLQELYLTAIRAGANRICLADTVGHATPTGVTNLVRFIVEMLREHELTGIKIDWHGHRDRGLSVLNSLSAIEAGAHRVHGTAFGIGERCGNTPLDVLMVNCKLMGYIQNDLTKLYEYCQFISRSVHVPISPNYMVVGRDAFRTATGVHAAAVIKAEEKGHAWLADRIYSGVPASLVGREQIIEIGPMSGESGVIYWLKRHNLQPRKKLIEAVFSEAKKSQRILTDEEVMAIIEREVGERQKETRSDSGGKPPRTRQARFHIR